MSSHMPPIPPASRSPQGPGGRKSKDAKSTTPQREPPQHAAEQGDTANIKQNTTNEGYFRGRRVK